MCGICGIIDYSGNNPDRHTLEKMTQSINHRGPDDSGVYLSGPVGLGHVRLSIIDLSEAGHQPMIADGETAVLAYNGEVYNFQSIKSELQALGVLFKSTSDTEVILQAFLKWGVDSFSRFDGMFAFAVFDATARKTYLVRDRFGIKPLYYSKTENGLIFGSEIKAILASGRFVKAINWDAFHEYLYFGNALGEKCFYEGCKKLLPGHYISIDEHSFHLEAYTSIYPETPCDHDVETAGKNVCTLLDEAVKSHLIADVPVGVFLSGGIDSSALVAYGSRHYQGKMKTYSAAFDFDKGVNELGKARKVANHFGTDHHELNISGGDLPSVIETLVHHHDEPFADAADIPLFLLCKEIKGSVKVVLQGDGGDEIFAGYRRYNAIASEKLLHLAGKIGVPLGEMVPSGFRKSIYHRMMRVLKLMSKDDPVTRVGLLLSPERLEEPPSRFFTPEFRNLIEKTDQFSRYKTLFNKFEDLDAVQRLLYIDCGIILPDTYLEKVDKSTMAMSVEVRVPLLDNALTKYVMGLNSSTKVKRGQKKLVMRQALRGVVPDEVLDAPKTGFGVPFEYWLSGPLSDYMKSVFHDESVRKWGVFDYDSLDKAVEEHISGERNHGTILYKLLQLAIWYRKEFS